MRQEEAERQSDKGRRPATVCAFLLSGWDFGLKRWKNDFAFRNSVKRGGLGRFTIEKKALFW
jgi:hypothetical protein